MHIRTIGELHDTINAQANEIAQLKMDIISLKTNNRTVRDNFKKYRDDGKLVKPKTRIEKLKEFIAENYLGENTNRKAVFELSDIFSLSPHTVRDTWQRINRQAVLA